MGFQYLNERSPFDDPVMRGKLRAILNAAPDIDLPLAKLELRPSFRIEILADKRNEDAVAEALQWFMKVVVEHPDHVDTGLTTTSEQVAV